MLSLALNADGSAAVQDYYWYRTALLAQLWIYFIELEVAELFRVRHFWEVPLTISKPEVKKYLDSKVKLYSWILIQRCDSNLLSSIIKKVEWNSSE